MIFDELCEKLPFEVNYAKSQHRRISEALLIHVLTCNDRDVVVNFEPGKYMRKMIFQSVRQTAQKKESEYELNL